MKSLRRRIEKIVFRVRMSRFPKLEQPRGTDGKFLPRSEVRLRLLEKAAAARMSNSSGVAGRAERGPMKRASL